MFARDLRDGEHRAFPQMQLMLQILGHFSPQRLRSRPNTRDPQFEEVVIPAMLAAFNVDLSGLSGLLKPSQDMANAISIELARGRCAIPAFTPFIYPRIGEPPWPVSSNEHMAAVAKWRSNARQAKRGASPHAVPIQAWVLYQLRFLLTAELLGALSTFGGFGAGVNHLSIVLNIATTDTIAVALAYNRLVTTFLEEKARSRDETALAADFFSSFLSNENAAFRGQAAVESAPRPVSPKAAPPVTPKNPPQAEPPAPRHQHWNRRKAAAAAPSPRRLSRTPKRRSRTPFRRNSPRKKNHPPPPTKQKKR